ncbi:phage holin family protein, partial [Guyparkeria sp. 1SP6A2]|nr:phage holin family protein [Guyparkeria sp. 1SP6A2]
GGFTTDNAITVTVVALVFGVVNAFIKPLLRLISLPFIIVTLGLFLVVVNAAMLMLTSAISGGLGLDFAVDGWGAAFLGAIVVSIVSMLVGGVLQGD